MRGCNASLADEPTRLLRLPQAELADYRLCLDGRARYVTAL